MCPLFETPDYAILFPLFSHSSVRVHLYTLNILQGTLWQSLIFICLLSHASIARSSQANQSQLLYVTASFDTESFVTRQETL